MAINGAWTNELGSRLILEDLENGRLGGTYVTAVGGPEGQPFPLTGGYVLPQGTGAPIPLAWTVAWTGWGSTTSWCGLLFDDGTITTTWILTSTIAPDEGWWQSMNVGGDTFAMMRERPTAEIRKAAARRGASHPLRKP